MQIEALRDRVYYLAGQLEEAKKVFEAAIKEVEDAKKEQDRQRADVPTPPSN